jgi:hypothetical protein
VHADLVPASSPAHDRPAATPERAHRRPATLALMWSAGTGLWALTWALGLLPHPFGLAEQVASGAVLNLWHPMIGSMFVLVLGVLGVGCASVMRAGPRPTHEGDRTALAVETLAWAIAGTITALLLHGTVIAIIAYTPVVLTLGWSTPELREAYVETMIRPDVVFQLSSLVGVVLWGQAALVQRRVRAAACSACGRAAGWSQNDEVGTRRRALRVGRIAVSVAVVSALVYPAVRLPWAFGHPAGMDAATWTQLQADGAVTTGVALGAAGLGGAVLMLGLVQGWGERFPRWMAGLAGRRVPVSLAVVPALVVAVALTASGRGFLMGALGVGFAKLELGAVHVVPLVSLLPWGVALGVATAAYAVRRRSECGTCEQGLTEVPARELRRLASPAVPPGRQPRRRAQGCHTDADLPPVLALTAASVGRMVHHARRGAGATRTGRRGRRDQSA